MPIKHIGIHNSAAEGKNAGFTKNIIKSIMKNNAVGVVIALIIFANLFIFGSLELIKKVIDLCKQFV